MSSWERQFVFIEGGNLMAALKNDVVGTLLLELDNSTVAHAVDTDDRLHAFTVISAKKLVFCLTEFVHMCLNLCICLYKYTLSFNYNFYFLNLTILLLHIPNEIKMKVIIMNQLKNKYK